MSIARLRSARTRLLIAVIGMLGSMGCTSSAVYDGKSERLQGRWVQPKRAQVDGKFMEKVAKDPFPSADGVTGPAAE